tara:strand:+ start:866 stop:1639 length:774 start_codon:yes stop_codon:yes gene_type:complete
LQFYLDFDGVISDSANECIENAYNAWLHRMPNIFDNLNDSEKSLRKQQIIDYGISNRYLVIPPEHYYCLIDCISDGISNTKKKLSRNHVKQLFLLKVKSVNNKTLKEFRDDFFSFRNSKFNIQSDRDWFRENPPTSFIKRLFDLIVPYSCRVAIVSRKNYEAINKWFLGSEFSNVKIYGNEHLDKFKNKFTLIKHLQQQTGFQNAVFIDDMVSEFGHYNWKKINVLTMTAGWGYNDLQNNEEEILNILNRKLNDLFN